MGELARALPAFDRFFVLAAEFIFVRGLGERLVVLLQFQGLAPEFEIIVDVGKDDAPEPPVAGVHLLFRREQERFVFRKFGKLRDLRFEFVARARPSGPRVGIAAAVHAGPDVGLPHGGAFRRGYELAVRVERNARSELALRERSERGQDAGAARLTLDFNEERVELVEVRCAFAVVCGGVEGSGRFIRFLLGRILRVSRDAVGLGGVDTLNSRTSPKFRERFEIRFDV